MRGFQVEGFLQLCYGVLLGYCQPPCQIAICLDMIIEDVMILSLVCGEENNKFSS